MALVGALRAPTELPSSHRGGSIWVDRGSVVGLAVWSGRLDWTTEEG